MTASGYNIITLDGDTYTLPCKIKDFVDNGWEIHSTDNDYNDVKVDGESQTLPGQSEIGVELTKGENEIEVEVYNASDEEQIFNELDVIELTIYSGKSWEYMGLNKRCNVEDTKEALGDPKSYSKESYGVYAEWEFEVDGNTIDVNIDWEDEDSDVDYLYFIAYNDDVNYDNKYDFERYYKISEIDSTLLAGDFKKGKVSGETYTNEYLGITATLEYPWEFATSSELESLNEQFYEEGEYYWDVETSAIYDMYAYTGENSENIAVIVYSMEDGEESLAINSNLATVGELMVEMAQEEIAGHGLEVTYEADTSITFPADKFVAYRMNIGGAGYEEVICFKKDNYLVTVTLSASDEDKLNEMIASFKSTDGNDGENSTIGEDDSEDTVEDELKDSEGV